ncbi:sulfotransferase [Henriciella sp. AS95]|uniref:sulfotransferase n=1 Tax=Henriciella sp. AS95 TaxID=3135782 RepID=UPI0031715E7C
MSRARDLKRVMRALHSGDLELAQQLTDSLIQEHEVSSPDNIHEIPFDASVDVESSTRDQGYVFVSGAPRSGTTALGKLLSLHPKISMFIELYSSRFGYRPGMFDPKEIKRFHEMGVLKSLDQHRNPAVFDAMTDDAIVGDKRPNFMDSAALTLNHFKNQKLFVVHVVRDPFEVAHSYIERARNGTWPADRDHTVAVKELNQNNKTALSLSRFGLAGQNQHLIVLNYATFWSDVENLVALFDKLGLDSSAIPHRDLEQFCKSSIKVSEKPRELTQLEQNEIESQFDFETYEALLAECTF